MGASRLEERPQGVKRRPQQQGVKRQPQQQGSAPRSGPQAGGQAGSGQMQATQFTDWASI